MTAHALMVAAEDGHVETVVALIKHGADVNLTDLVSFWINNNYSPSPNLKLCGWQDYEVIMTKTY